MPKILEPSAAIKRMRDATNSMERTMDSMTADLNRLRADHARTLRRVEAEYKRGYTDGYRRAVADVREKAGCR